MTGCVLGSQYIPSVEYFAHCLHHQTIWLEQHEHFQKRTWRNKTAILSPVEPIHLTVPLQKGKHQQKDIKEVMISDEVPWQQIHLRSIQTAYGKTAFVKEIMPGLESILLTRHTTLWSLNLSLLHWIVELIGLPIHFDLTETYHEKYPDEITDLRKGVPGGFIEKTISPMLQYQQVQRLDKPHLPNLCILDALCHLGPETQLYLARYASYLYPEQ